MIFNGKQDSATQSQLIIPIQSMIKTDSNESVTICKDKLSDEDLSQKSICIRSNYQIDDSVNFAVKSVKSHKRESNSNCYSITTASAYKVRRGKFGSRSGARTTTMQNNKVIKLDNSIMVISNEADPLLLDIKS